MSVGKPYDPDRVFIPEGERAILCSMWAGHGEPVANPALTTNMFPVGWSASEAGALNLAEQAVALGRATGNPAAGYLLTGAGRALIE
jgi:hypothetical protein